LLGRFARYFGHLGLGKLAAEAAQHMGYRGRVDGGDLPFGNRAIEQAVGHRRQVGLVVGKESLGTREAGKVGRHGHGLGLHGFVSRAQVSTQGVDGGHLRVKFFDRRPAYAPQPAIDHRK